MTRRPHPLAALALALLVPALAHAHSQPFSWLDLHVAPAGISGEAVAHIVDLAHEAGLPAPDSLRSRAFVSAHQALLGAVLVRRLDVRADGERLAPRVLALAVVPERNAVRFTFTLPAPRAGELTVAGPLFDWEAQHETYFNVWVGDSLKAQDVLDRGHRTGALQTGVRPSLWRVARRFLAEGVHHIFIGPDHILFIAGLLLLGGGLKRLTKIVTAFTVAHSVTLALATFGIVNPPARIIEPLIALSIVVVGIENLLAGGKRDLRPWLAFGFGFVHGFGFASVLRELTLPREALGAALFSFNAGVEVGQLTIVLALAPVLAWVRRRRPAAAPHVLAWGSALVIAAGSWWFVQRAFFAS